MYNSARVSKAGSFLPMKRKSQVCFQFLETAYEGYKDVFECSNCTNNPPLQKSNQCLQW